MHRRTRAGVRRFLSRFAGWELEVALEATTGWRFVVDELEHVGAGVHLAEPAETTARRGKKSPRRPIGLTPASARVAVDRPATGLWIPTDHILDLRATVRYRHTLSHQRTEWQQRIQSVFYHHGCRQRRKLMTAEGVNGLLELARDIDHRETLVQP